MPDAPPVDAAPIVLPPPLIPLGPHDEWHYESTRTRGDKTETCMVVQTVVGTMTIDGRDAGVFSRAQTCSKGTQTSTFYVAESDEVDGFETRLDSEVVWTMFEAPEEGHTWNCAESGTPVQLTWHHLETVTVAAGTFGDCWAAATVDASETHTYCRKIGEVMVDSTEPNGTVTHSELMSKSF